MIYETFGQLIDGSEHRLYCGTDSVAAVNHGLDDTEHLITWVTEDGRIIPETVAS